MTSIKDQESVPDEILNLLENLKKFIKEQKAIREDNCCQRFSIEPLVQIETEMDDTIRSGLHKVEVEMQRSRKMVDSLKEETRNLLNDAEMAYRLVKSGAASIRRAMSNAVESHQSIPSVDKYFQNMISNFEEKMRIYSEQIKDLEAHLDNLNKPHNPEELFLIMKKQHEILIGLASQVYEIQDKLAKQRQIR